MKKIKNIKEAAFDDTLDIHDWDAQNPAEISGMGQSMTTFPDNFTAGFNKNTGSAYAPYTDQYEDPDKKKNKKLKRIKSFVDFKNSNKPK
jgi:hypothetical protein